MTKYVYVIMYNPEDSGDYSFAGRTFYTNPELAQEMCDHLNQANNVAPFEPYVVVELEGG